MVKDNLSIPGANAPSNGSPDKHLRGYPYPYGYPGADPYGPEPSAGGELDLLLLLAILWRRKILIASIIMLSALAVILYLRRATPIYESKAVLEVNLRPKTILPDSADFLQDRVVSGAKEEEAFNTIIEILKGPTLKARVESRLALASDGEQPADSFASDSALGIGTVVLEPIRRTRLVRITGSDPSPERAQEVVQTYCDAIEEHFRDSNIAMSESAVGWLQVQADSQRVAVQHAEDMLLEFRKTSGLQSKKAELALGEDAIQTIGDQIVNLTIERNMLIEVISAMEQIDTAQVEDCVVPEKAPYAAEIQQLLGRIHVLSDQHAEISLRYTELHPETQRVAQSLAAVKGQIAEAVRRSRSVLDLNRSVLDRQIEALTGQQRELEASTVGLEQEIALLESRENALRLEKDARQSSCDGVLKSIEEARLAAEENAATIRIAEPASGPGDPVHPRSLIVLALGLFLGTGCGCVLALLVEFCEDRLWRATDFGGFAGVPLLGMVPHAKSRDRVRNGRIAQSDPFHPVSEAYGCLRAIVESGDPIACVLVTGPGVGEGKTVTACNLAIAFARSGLKTLLVDLDLRHPQVAKIWSMADDAPSLLHALADDSHSEFARLVSADPKDTNLFLATTRRSNSISPGELLGQRITRSFLEWAREHYDRVVIDAPPIGVAGDVLSVVPSVDGVLLVCRYNKTRKSALRVGIHRVQQCQGRILGIVVTDAIGRYGYWGDAANYTQGSYRREKTDRWTRHTPRQQQPQET